MKVDDRQRFLMIAEAAYFRAQQRNFAPGNEAEDWFAAERQVDEMLGNLEAVPMAAQLQAGAEAKPATRQRRTKQAAATATGLAGAESAGATKPTRARRTKTTEATTAPAAKPGGRRKAGAAAAQNLENPDFMADMVAGVGTGEEALRTGMGDAGIGLGAERPAAQAGAGAAGATARAGTGAEAEGKSKRGRRPKAATATAEASPAPRRPGRPRKIVH